MWESSQGSASVETERGGVGHFRFEKRALPCPVRFGGWPRWIGGAISGIGSAPLAGVSSAPVPALSETFIPPAMRPWLVLGRVSNLPTVWSNCLAAWLIGGGGTLGRFLLLCLGASLIYIGGMFLNDACDVRFDRQHRRERPIPAGQVTAWRVWRASLGCLGFGWLCMATLSTATAGLGLLLVLAVVVYDAAHKSVPFAPIVMALCRYLLFLAAGAAARHGIDGTLLWSALVLGCYIVGLSYIARRETELGVIGWWPAIPLLVPLLLAGFLNAPFTWTRPDILGPVLWFLLVVGVAMAQLYRPIAQGGGPGRTVSLLLAGIVAVDAVAVMASPWPWGAVFVGLWLAALGLQRTIPAT